MKKQIRAKAGKIAVVTASIAALCFVLPTWQTASAKTSVLQSKMFDLSAPAAELFRHKKLQNGTVLQSIAFDSVNQHVFTVQLMAGGLKLPGETASVSGANRDLHGDMALTELDLAGNLLGYMYLKGFGHGVQIGVETVDGIPYLWTEADSKAEGKDGWGTDIARFKFENGKILTPDSPELEKFSLIDGTDRTTVNIDAANGLLTMRYRKDKAFHFALYDLEEVKRHVYEPIADVPQPTLGTFQGFATYGGYLYLLEGNAYGSGSSAAPVGNTSITTVEWSTGNVLDKELITAGDTLAYREPEGLGIFLPDVKHPQKAQLGIGFASDFTPLRLANIYTFDRLQPAEAILNGKRP